MYQFYYANQISDEVPPSWGKKLADEFIVSAIRPAMWEEHCLECSAPLCYRSCPIFVARADGRCKRFFNSLEVSAHANGCCKQVVRIKFRKWANMMTIIFPAMLSVSDYQALTLKNQRLGNFLKKILNSKLPMFVRWNYVRCREYLRRCGLRQITGLDNEPDAFVFHGWSFYPEKYNLVVEIFDDHTPVFKFSLPISPGENLHIIEKKNLSSECWTKNFLVKVYPENNLEAELEILWCDFVKGRRKEKAAPAAKVKCVAWDLDNTLWNGVLIETDNPEQLKLRAHVLDTIQKLDERGIIQSVASKNDYAAAFPLLEKLGIAQYFLYPQINWGAKSASLRTIAEALNIGIDTLALIDDSFFEREQVKAMLPQVRTYTETEVEGLLLKDEFSVPVTEESRKRREMYRAEEHRNQLKAEDKLDTIAFIKKCNLRINLFVPSDEKDIERCFELVVRTNQLNMSGIKYSHDEFMQAFHRQEHYNLAFSCEDDFGKYGIVCFCQYSLTEHEIVVREFAMSCRVAGKFVESAFFAYLLEHSQKSTGIFKVQKTAKNILLRKTLENIGFETVQDEKYQIFYQFSKNLVEKDLVYVTKIEELE